MSRIRLSDFNNAWYRPGRGIGWQLSWFFFGLPLLRSAFNPFSSLRVRLLRIFGARIGTGVVIKPGVRVKYPWRLEVGNHSWIGEDCWIDNLADVHIGSNVCVSQGVYFCTGNHDWSDPAFRLLTAGVNLRDGSWAGARSVLVPGITIGECAIAAAGSVVMRDIPASEVHAGNPAAFVRIRRIGEQQLKPESTAHEQVAS